jgi:hypothetical protein
MNRHNQLELVNENTIKDARDGMCFTFLRHVLLQCNALKVQLRMQVIVADSIALPGMAGLGGFHPPRESRPPAGPQLR